jgi:hypothetical protein
VLYKNKIYLIFILIFCFSGCGKKQKNIFDFTQKKINPKINKFELGFIKGITAKKTTSGNLITWNKLKTNKKHINNFKGYNIYRLVRSSIIPKKSLNKKIIENTNYLDQEIFLLPDDFKQKNYCYVIKPVFFIENKIFLGITSQIACTEKI